MAACYPLSLSSVLRSARLDSGATHLFALSFARAQKTKMHKKKTYRSVSQFDIGRRYLAKLIGPYRSPICCLSAYRCNHIVMFSPKKSTFRLNSNCGHSIAEVFYWT